MMSTANYLAFDLGAASGRAILGTLDGRRLELRELHRFQNGPVTLPDGLHWDVLRLWSEMVVGIGKAARESEGRLAGIGVDSWGVDFGLLDERGALAANPFHYRDNRTDGILEIGFARMPKEQIFELTGIQFMQINSLFQLLSMVEQHSPVLDIARTFLTIPDLFNYWLTGRAVSEFTHATTTQCFDPRQRTWSRPLLEAMGIDPGLFVDVIEPGTVVGSLLPSLGEETGAGAIPVIAPACHDTGSAVAAVPAQNPDFAWISSGTWSVIGAEVPAPVITPDSLAHNFTNEGGAANTFRLCKNITGLWLVQECRRTWAAQGERLSWDELTALAAEAPPFRCLIDPDFEEFLKPGDMPARVRAYARRTGQAVPESNGEVVRCILEGLALKYRYLLHVLEKLVGRRLDPVHIVGGGAQNQLLSQFTANATGRLVLTGPVEATATGNILMQALALGLFNSLAEVRAVVRRSADLRLYEPTRTGVWDQAYEQFLALLD